MKRYFLLPASLALCWTLSPEVLVRLGNGFGRYGQSFALALLVAAAISAAAAYLLHRPATDRNPMVVRKNGLDSTVMAVGLAGRLAAALLFSTGMLVSAGFTFNETFVYWFPNFGFSFLLLFTVLLLHLVGERAVLGAQQLFLVPTASGLLLLALVGLLSEPPAIQAYEAQENWTGSAFLGLIPLAMLCFPGFDQRLPEGAAGRFSFPAAVGLGLLLLGLWGWASLRHVPQPELAESSIPYVAGAKAILGQPGRLIMGMVIIGGTCGAVNGLFYLATCTVRQLVPRKINGSATAGKCSGWLPRLQAGLMALVIGLCLAMGLAGSDRLEVYIFGSLLLWLLAIGVDCLAAGRCLSGRWKSHPLLAKAVGALILGAVAYLASSYPQQLQLIYFCLPVLAAGCLFAALRVRSGLSANQNPQGDQP